MTDFPILDSGLIYLDTAASSQKPQVVIDAISDYYQTSHANVHRGIYQLAEQATTLYETARTSVASFVNARPEQVIFTSGTTASINALARMTQLKRGDVILLSELEHHSNIVPWQQAAKRTGASIKWIPVRQGRIDIDAAKTLIQEGLAVLAISHLSNVTGSVQPIKELAGLVHEQGGLIFVDGAQGIVHCEVDVQDLGVDAYCFSGHKVYGPTGIGVLYLSDGLLGNEPFVFGGEMIHEVTKQASSWAQPPHKFEAGTPPIAQAVGLAAALDWLSQQDRLSEQELVQRCEESLRELDFITVHSCQESTGLVTFTLAGVHAHDVAQFLDTKDIAVRAGHHCTQIYHEVIGVSATCRASFGLYNSQSDVDALLSALKECKEAFGV